MALLQIKRRLTKIEKFNKPKSGRGYSIALWDEVLQAPITQEEGIERYCMANPEQEQDLREALKCESRYVIFLVIVG